MFVIFFDSAAGKRRKRLSRVGVRPDPPLKPFTNSSLIYVSYTAFLRGFINSQGYYNRRAPIPSNSTYATFIDTVTASPIKDKNELSAFMAHVLVSSKGLTVSRENNTSIIDDLTRTYFRRGYLGIKGADDYKQASLDVFGDLRLLDVPELILQDESINWKVSLWNWKRSLTDPIDFNLMAKGLIGWTSCDVVYNVYAILKKEWDPKGEPFSKCKIEKVNK